MTGHLEPGDDEIVREWRFRSRIPISHAEYEDEPAGNVDWFAQLDQVAAEIHGGD